MFTVFSFFCHLRSFTHLAGKKIPRWLVYGHQVYCNIILFFNKCVPYSSQSAPYDIPISNKYDAKSPNTILIYENLATIRKRSLLHQYTTSFLSFTAKHVSSIPFAYAVIIACNRTTKLFCAEHKGAICKSPHNFIASLVHFINPRNQPSGNPPELQKHFFWGQ